MERFMRKTINKFFLHSFFIVLSILSLNIRVAISSEGLNMTFSQKIQDKESTNLSEAKQEELVYRLSLRDALKVAFRYNRLFLNTTENIIIANLNLLNAESVFGVKLTPSVTENIAGSNTSTTTATESYDVSLNKRLITGADMALSARTTASDNSTNSYASNLTASLTQPLLRGAWPLVVTSGLVDAERNSIVQELIIEQQRQGLILQVISAYYQILNQIELVDINAKSLERVEKFLLATRERLKVGLASQLDLLRAELQVSSQKQSLISAREDLRNREEAFNILLGLQADEKVELVDEIVYQPVELDMSKSISTALENRIDYKIAKMTIEDIERQVKIRVRDQLPIVDLSGSYTISQTDPSFNNSWSLSNNEWRVGLTARYTFPATPELVSYEQTNIILRNQKRLLEEMRENIVRQVKFDLRSATETIKRIELVKEEVEQAEKRLKIATLRFEKGMADNLEVILAEENLLRAKNNYSSTVSNHVITQSRLKLTMGVLHEE